MGIVTIIEKFIIDNHEYMHLSHMAEYIGITESKVLSEKKRLKRAGLIHYNRHPVKKEDIEYYHPIHIKRELVKMSLNSSQPLIQIMALNRLEDIEKEENS